MTPVLGHLFALLTAGCWAQNSIVYAAAGKRVGSQTVTHIRLWIALPIIFMVNFIFTGTVFPAGLSGTTYLLMGISGFLGFCVADLFIFYAFVEIGPRETLVVLTLSPIFSTVISWIFLKELLSPLQIIGILATVGGVIWVVLVEKKGRKKREKNERLGLLFAFLGAVSQACGMVLARQGLESNIHPVSANLLRICAGVIGLAVFTLLRGSFISDFRKMKDRRALLLLTSGAVIGPVIGIILTMYALTLAPVGIVTAIMQTSPVILLPVDKFVFKMKIPLGAVGGTVLAIGGAAILFLI